MRRSGWSTSNCGSAISSFGRPWRAALSHAAMIDGEDEGTMSLGAAELLVESAIEECERFLPGVPVRPVGRQDRCEALAAALIETQGEA